MNVKRFKTWILPRFFRTKGWTVGTPDPAAARRAASGYNRIGA